MLYRVLTFGQIPTEHEVWLPGERIANLADRGRTHYEDKTDVDIDVKPTQINYNIVKAHNFIQGGSGHNIIEDNSTTINIKDCNLNLQGNFNELAQELIDTGQTEEAKVLENTIKALEKAEHCETVEEVQKSGIKRRLDRVMDELNNKDSSLRRAVDGTRYGVGILQDIGKGYNSVAQWLAMPQVPDAFLNKKK